jgi:hypothetical protein
MIRVILFGGLAVAALTAPIAARAQSSSVVSSCGAQSYTPGTTQNPTMDTTGNACANGATVAAVPSTNASSTVTAGGTYQTVFASSTGRRGCLIQNPVGATELLSVRQGGATVWTLPAGGVFSCAAPGGLVVSDLIEVTAATTGHAFSAASQ